MERIMRSFKTSSEMQLVLDQVETLQNDIHMVHQMFETLTNMMWDKECKDIPDSQKLREWRNKIDFLENAQARVKAAKAKAAKAAAKASDQN